MNLKVNLDRGAYPLIHAHNEDAGYDIRTPHDAYLPSHGSIVIDSGVHTEIPYGYVGMLKSKSGLNTKNSIVGTGTIDCGYTGSIRVKLYNLGNEPYMFKAGDKIIQLVIEPIALPEIVYVDEIGGGERGSNGFGSTGK